MDILERLLVDNSYDTREEAADEIERLREENDTLKATVINLLAKEFEHVKVFKPKLKKTNSANQQNGGE